MKKILLLLCALLGSVGVMADVISDANELSNSKAYTITTARGAWTLKTDGSAIVSTKTNSGNNVYAEADQTAEAQEFAIYKFNDLFYIYNLKAEKFVVLNGTSAQLYQHATTPFILSTSNNAGYPLRFSTWDSRNYANNNNSGLILIDSYSNQDDGNRLAIEAARDLTSDETTAISDALAASPILNMNKAFTVTANRGTWCANAAGNSLATTATNTSPAAGYDQFAVMFFDNTFYLYNVGTKKFIKKDGSLKEGRGDAINVRYSGDNTYPYMFFFPDGPVYFNMQNGGGSYAMNNYSTPDPGNKQSIAQADPAVDPYDDALEQYNRTVSVTYKLNYDGEQVGTATKTERLGVAPVLPSSIDKGFAYTYSTELIQSGTTTVTATVNLPFTASPDYVGAKWYNMYIRKDTRWVPYSDSSEPYTPYAATDADKETKALQWAFVGNPFTTGIKVINRAAGRNKSLTKDGDNAVMRDGDTYWDLFGRNGGILLREHGTDNNYINQNGGENGDFKFWNSGWAPYDDGSTMWLVEAPVETTTITYHVMYNGNDVKTATATAVVDDPTPLTKIPNELKQDFVTLTGDDTHIIVANDNIDLTATWNGLSISDDYASAHWYDMSVRSNWYVTSGNVDGDGALKTVEANALGLGEDAYQWAFVGDPYHLKLYNKAKGSDLVYAWTSTDNASVPDFTAASTSENYWCLRRSTATGDAYANAFLLTIPSLKYQVNQFGGAGGSLKIWAATGTHDVGSAFKVFDVPTDYSTFLNDEITPYMGSGYFCFTDAVKTAMGWNPAYTTSCTLQQYKDMRDGYAAIDKADLSNYTLPETGYYRFKNVNYEKYMGLKAATVYGNYNSEADINGPATVVKLTKGTGDNVGKYSIQLQGKYLQGLTKSTNVPFNDDAAWFTPTIPTIGTGTFSTTPESTYTFIHCAGGGEIVGWTNDAAASKWVIEDATTIKVAISDAEYATLCVPFPVTIPSGVKAYTVSGINGGLLTLAEISTTIPSGTAVILEGDEGTYTFNITGEVSPIASNELTGTYLQIAAPNNSYILQNHSGDVGFYKVDTSEATPTIPANRAYFAAPSSVKAFFFNGGDADAIKSVFSGIAEGKIFDLSGRKVAKMQKGKTYIVNGQKVNVK